MSDDRYIGEVYDYLNQHPEIDMSLPPVDIARQMMLDAAQNGTWASEDVKQSVIDSIMDFGKEKLNSKC